MILVVGSTGILGQEITNKLVQQGAKVRALVRQESDQEKVAALKALGVEVFVGDLKSYESLKRACSGVDKVVSTASATFSRQEGDSIETVDQEGQVSLVKAADEAGVKRFVLISFPDNPEIDFPLSRAKRAVEEALSNSNMEWCSLQASYFMEIWLSPHVGFDYPNNKANIYGTGEEEISWISYKDVASLAVAALENSYFTDKEVPIGGPRAVSPNEVVRIFENASGQSFQVEYVPAEALAQQQSAADNSLDESFAALMRKYAMGDAMDMDEIVQRTGIELTSVEDYAAGVSR